MHETPSSPTPGRGALGTGPLDTGPSGAEHLHGAAAFADDATTRNLRERLAPHLPGYRLGAPLGRGGMGLVLRARHVALDREVAIKILLPPPGEVAGWYERFRREARSLAKLAHPGIVTVHDFGQTEGVAWIVMEAVEGTSLRALLEDGHLTPTEALALVPQICEALQYAHENGVVHRDVKPENVLVDVTGRVRLVDFGLAKLATDEDGLRLTRTHQALGTLRYMAPEQLDAPDTVDHRADIFALGVVLYEMLTGEVPQGVFAPPSKKAGVDVRLDEIVLRALEREPARRYQHASEIRDRVEDLERNAEPTVEPVATAHADASPEEPSGEPPPLSTRLVLEGATSTRATDLPRLMGLGTGLDIAGVLLSLVFALIVALRGNAVFMVHPPLGALFGVASILLVATFALAIVLRALGLRRYAPLARAVMGLLMVFAVVSWFLQRIGPFGADFGSPFLVVPSPLLVALSGTLALMPLFTAAHSAPSDEAPQWPSDLLEGVRWAGVAAGVGGLATALVFSRDGIEPGMLTFGIGAASLAWSTARRGGGVASAHACAKLFTRAAIGGVLFTSLSLAIDGGAESRIRLLLAAFGLSFVLGLLGGFSGAGSPGEGDADS